jgi:nitrite reductase (NADH) large subunit
LNVLGQKQKYEGTIPSNTLKVVGIDLTSVGKIHPEDESFEELRVENTDKGIYKKIMIRNGEVCGLICIGTKKGVSEISRLISRKANVEKWKNNLLDDDFDYSVV